MKLPTMDELRVACENGAIVDWHLETAFYHGWMAALDQIDCTNPLISDLVEELRDQANADMAAEIGA